MINSQILHEVNWECIHFISKGDFIEIKNNLIKTSFSILECDVSCIFNDHDFFCIMSNVFNLPGYFGFNWDALDECLCDLSWFLHSGYILFLHGSNEFWKNSPSIAGNLISIWLSSAEWWSKDKIPFHLIFVLNNA